MKKLVSIALFIVLAVSIIMIFSSPSNAQYPYYQNPYPYQPSPSYPSTSQYPYYQSPYPYYQNPYPYQPSPTYPYPPPYQNQPPIANAGPNQIVNQGAVVTLDGTRSYDPSGGTIVAYSWVQTAGPPVTLNGANTATPIFRADVVSGTVLAFSLTVTNNNGLTSNNAAIVYITVR